MGFADFHQNNDVSIIFPILVSRRFAHNTSDDFACTYVWILLFVVTLQQNGSSFQDFFMRQSALPVLPSPVIAVKGQQSLLETDSDTRRSLAFAL